MRVCLTVGQGSGKQGYTAIDCVTGGDSVILGSVTNLDEHVEDAEATEIVANEVLDFMNPNDVDGIIEHWVTKLRKGGSLTIGGVDLPSVSQAIANGEISLDEGNLLLYGKQNLPWNYHKTTTSLLQIVSKLSGLGLRIMSKRYLGYYYQVTGVRN